MRDAPPKVIHMPLEELLDPELSFDDPESAGENPTAYVLKTDVDEQERQRDMLLGIVKDFIAVIDGADFAAGDIALFNDTSIRAAIAECEGGRDS